MKKRRTGTPIEFGDKRLNWLGYWRGGGVPIGVDRDPTQRRSLPDISDGQLGLRVGSRFGAETQPGDRTRTSAAAPPADAGCSGHCDTPTGHHRLGQSARGRRPAPIGQQPGVGGDAAAVELQLQAALEIDPQGAVI